MNKRIFQFMSVILEKNFAFETFVSALSYFRVNKNRLDQVLKFFGKRVYGDNFPIVSSL